MSSNISNPLEFFEDFFPERFDKLHNDFFNFNTKKVSGTNDADYCEEPYYMVECNREKGYISIEEAAFANEEHKPYCFKKYFDKELENTLRPEFDKTLKQCVNSLYLKNENEQKIYLHTQFLEIDYIINFKLNGISNAKYLPQCKHYFVQYIKEIGLRYPELVENESIYKKILEKDKQEKLTFITLLIPPEKQKHIQRLYKELMGEFISEETTLETFTKAFTAIYLSENESLNIKWMIVEKGHCFIGALVIMLDYMVSKGYLYPYDDRQLSNIFIKLNGDYIKPQNWNERRADANDPNKKKTPAIFSELKGIIDHIMRNKV